MATINQAAAMVPQGPTLLGAPVEFYLFGLMLVGVAIFHKRALAVSLAGLLLILAYQALVTSGEPAFAQSALFERFYRNLRVLAGGDEAEFQRLVAGTVLRPELRDAIGSLRPPSGRIAGRVDAGMRRVYDARMRVMGQNGISDYDAGFTNFLYTFETSATARQVPPPVGALHRRPPAAL